MGRPLPHDAAALAGAGPSLALHLEGIEVTQVIQNLAHAVPLIAGKTTVARVYLAVPAGTPPAAVRGQISVELADGARQMVASVNAVTVRPLPAAGIRSLREDLSASLNFLLPPEVLGAGTIKVAVDKLTSAGGGTITFSPASSASVRLLDTPPLRVKLIGLRYVDPSTGETHAPAERDFQFAHSWLRRAYPVGEVQATRLTTDIPTPWPFKCQDANLFLASLRRQDLAAGGDARVHYFGLVSDGAGFMRGCASDVPDHVAPDTVASGPVGSYSWDWDFDGSYADWYTGHELGHTFGRAHPGFCNGNSSDDPDFPFPNGQLSTNDGAFVGFDPGDTALGLPMTALPGQTWHDVMTYCERQWMCNYTYAGIRDRLVAEDQQFAPAETGPEGMLSPLAALPVAPERLVHVLAKVEMKAGTVEIVSVQPVARGIPSHPFPESDATVEVLDVADGVLVSIPIRVKKSTCGEEREEAYGMIDALVSAPPPATQVRILWRGREAARWAASVPAAAATAPEESVLPTSQSYIIQAKRSETAPWETLATGLPTPEFRLDRDLFPGLSKIFVRVLATDGFSTRVVREDILNPLQF